MPRVIDDHFRDSLVKEVQRVHKNFKESVRVVREEYPKFHFFNPSKYGFPECHDPSNPIVQVKNLLDKTLEAIYQAELLVDRQRDLYRYDMEARFRADMLAKAAAKAGNKKDENFYNEVKKQAKKQEAAEIRRNFRILSNNKEKE